MEETGRVRESLQLERKESRLDAEMEGEIERSKME